MIYEMHDLQKTRWGSILPWAEATATLLAPLRHAPCLTHSRQIAAGCELLVRLCRAYPKPEYGLMDTVIDGERVAVTESVMLHKPFCRLLHFERATSQTHPVVLVVAPLSGHHATLLRDTVRTMLPDFDIYLTEWIDARMVPMTEGGFHLDDYVAYVREFVGFLGPDIHVVSVCQSTVPVLAAISLMANNGEPTPNSITLMGGPIDARRGETKVNHLAISKPLDWFERELIATVPSNYPGAGRKVYPGFLQHAAFVAMDPERHLKSHLKYYFDVSTGNAEAASAHRRFHDEYNAVLDMAGEYYLETVQSVFHEYRLARRVWRVCGEHVRPHAVRTTALITVEGDRDDICGAGQTHAAHDLCTGLDDSHKHALTALGCGHYGIFSGNAWRTAIYPQIRELIHRYQSREAAESGDG